MIHSPFNEIIFRSNKDMKYANKVCSADEHHHCAAVIIEHGQFDVKVLDTLKQSVMPIVYFENVKNLLLLSLINPPCGITELSWAAVNVVSSKILSKKDLRWVVLKDYLCRHAV